MNVIEHYLRMAIDEAVAGDRDFFVTLDVVNDDSKWVQLAWDCLNLAYPLSSDPLSILAEQGIRLPKSVALADWKEREYVTFDHGAEPIQPLVEFIETYCLQVLSLKVGPDTFRAVRS